MVFGVWRDDNWEAKGESSKVPRPTRHIAQWRARTGFWSRAERPSRPRKGGFETLNFPHQRPSFLLTNLDVDHSAFDSRHSYNQRCGYFSEDVVKLAGWIGCKPHAKTTLETHVYLTCSQRCLPFIILAASNLIPWMECHRRICRTYSSPEPTRDERALWYGHSLSTYVMNLSICGAMYMWCLVSWILPTAKSINRQPALRSMYQPTQWSHK